MSMGRYTCGGGAHVGEGACVHVCEGQRSASVCFKSCLVLGPQTCRRSYTGWPAKPRDPPADVYKHTEDCKLTPAQSTIHGRTGHQTRKQLTH